jgi:hypothetical protein
LLGFSLIIYVVICRLCVLVIALVICETAQKCFNSRHCSPDGHVSQEFLCRCRV